MVAAVVVVVVLVVALLFCCCGSSGGQPTTQTRQSRLEIRDREVKTALNWGLQSESSLPQNGAFFSWLFSSFASASFSLPINKVDCPAAAVAAASVAFLAPSFVSLYIECASLFMIPIYNKMVSVQTTFGRQSGGREGRFCSTFKSRPLESSVAVHSVPWLMVMGASQPMRSELVIFFECLFIELNKAKRIFKRIFFKEEKWYIVADMFKTIFYFDW